MCYDIFFYFSKSCNLKKVEAVKQVTKVVSDIWIKSGIPMKSNWLHCKQLFGMHDKWEKLKKIKNRESNTERSKRKKFCEDLQKLFDIAAENAEELIYADRLRTKAAKEKDVAFLRDQRSTREMQISSMDYETKSSYKKNVKKLNLH